LNQLAEKRDLLAGTVWRIPNRRFGRKVWFFESAKAHQYWLNLDSDFTALLRASGAINSQLFTRHHFRSDFAFRRQPRAKGQI
jgi:hypothetical protein